MMTLKKLRGEKKLIQTQIATQIGITQQAYSLIENEQLVPSLKTAIAIATFFDCSVEEIFLLKKQVEIVFRGYYVVKTLKSIKCYES